MFKDPLLKSWTKQAFFKGEAQGSDKGQTSKRKHSPCDLKQICWQQGRLFSSMVKLDLLGILGSLFPQGQYSVEISKKLQLGYQLEGKG